MIGAIETKYAGQLFRSKLEARWAFFFDRCGVKWKYEYEGFSLPSGNYLPDFYLPGPNRFLEIKPEFMQPTDRWRAYQLLKELWETTGTECWLAQGEPVDNFVRGFGDRIELSKWGNQKTWMGEEAIFVTNEMDEPCLSFKRPKLTFIDSDILYIDDLSLAEVVNPPNSYDRTIEVPVTISDPYFLDVPVFAFQVAEEIPGWVRDRGVTHKDVFKLIVDRFEFFPEWKYVREKPMIFHGCNFMSAPVDQTIKSAADAAAAAFRFNHKVRA